MSMTMRIVLLALLFSAIVLGYGYWHAKTHGALNVSIYDLSHKQTFALLKDTAVVLKDEGGTVLATGKSDSRYGTVYLSHPETGSCYDAERKATGSKEGMNNWQRCFRQQSTWLMEWVRQARFVDIQLKDCRLGNIPVSIKEYSDAWWMWWVPLPHVGGKPYTYFSLTLRLDPVACRVQT
jgi:hypothetical protein